MKVIFYRRSVKGTGGQLQKMMNYLVPKNNMEIFSTVDVLARRLQQSSYDIVTAVLLIANREDLSGILSVRQLLGSTRVILVLPDRKDETIAMGHRLRPRFLSYSDSDFIDVAVVLEKMLKVFDFRINKQQRRLEWINQ